MSNVGRVKLEVPWSAPPKAVKSAVPLSPSATATEIDPDPLEVGLLQVAVAKAVVSPEFDWSMVSQVTEAVGIVLAVLTQLAASIAIRERTNT
jgi:hypothetical protein